MRQLKAVVFDMDDTLLDINLAAFIAMLAMDESNLLAHIARRRPFSLFGAYASSMLELNAAEREEGGATNRRIFERAIERRCGVPLSDPIIADVLTCYEREVLPGKNNDVIAARPRAGAHAAIECALDRGLRIALLTNPAFTRDCIECRMGWGSLLDAPFELVTTMENTSHCKPTAAYYLEALDALGLDAREVLMVGNDPKRDFPAPSIGLQTAYVGQGSVPAATWCGSMAEFARNFDQIEERFYSRQLSQERIYIP